MRARRDRASDGTLSGRHAGSVLPSEGSAGARHVVTVIGSGFGSSGAVWCRAGQAADQQHEAALLSSTTITCLLPRSMSAGNATVEVSLNGIDFTSSSQVFAVQPRSAAMLQMMPSSGPVLGSTVLTVHGGPWLTSSVLRCVFGPHQVLATRLSSSTSTCIAPAGEGIGRVIFAIGTT